MDQNTKEHFKEIALSMLTNIKTYIDNISIWNVTYHWHDKKWHDKIIFKRSNRITHADRLEISLERYLPDSYQVRIALIINEGSKAEITVPDQDFIDKFKEAFKVVSSKIEGNFYENMINDFFGPRDMH